MFIYTFGTYIPRTCGNGPEFSSDYKITFYEDHLVLEERLHVTYAPYSVGPFPTRSSMRRVKIMYNKMLVDTNGTCGSGFEIYAISDWTTTYHIYADTQERTIMEILYELGCNPHLDPYTVIWSYITKMFRAYSKPVAQIAANVPISPQQIWEHIETNGELIHDQILDVLFARLRRESTDLRPIDNYLARWDGHRDKLIDRCINLVDNWKTSAVGKN